jgi:hypothetical protein
MEVMRIRLSTDMPWGSNRARSPLKDFLDEDACANHNSSGCLRQADEIHNGRSLGEEIVNVKKYLHHFPFEQYCGHIFPVIMKFIDCCLFILCTSNKQLDLHILF